MKILRALLVVVVLVGLLGAGGFFLFRQQVAEAVFKRALAENVGLDLSAELPDGLHVFICGAGSPMPDPQRAGPCIGVLAGQRAFIIDTGSGSARRLGRMGFPFDKLESIYLTHLHSDHIDGLGEMLLQAWVGPGRTSPTPVAGPRGVEEVVAGFNAAYRLDSTYRVAHHGPNVVNPGGFGGVAETLPSAAVAPATIVNDGGLTIDIIGVNHSPVEPALGFRFRYGGRSVVISGDTVYHPGLVSAAKDVDLLVHEALQPTMVSAIADAADAAGRRNVAAVMRDILDYHATPEDAARAAAEAGAKQLAIYHIVPPLPSRLLEPLFLGDAKAAFDGPITVAQDGMVFSLPAGSDRIDRRHIR